MTTSDSDTRNTIEPAPTPSRRRRKDKVRSAWIAFAGRIIAQTVGACATVWLGLHFVQQTRLQPALSASEPAAPAATDVAVPAASRAAAAHGRERSIVVLPLQDLSPAAGQGYLADGLTTALIARLAGADSLHVLSQTSSMAYKGQPKPLPAIAAELGVSLVLEGAVTRTQDRIRVTMQLVEASTDEPIWTRTFDEASADVLVLQDRVAGTASAELTAAIANVFMRRRA